MCLFAALNVFTTLTIYFVFIGAFFEVNSIKAHTALHIFVILISKRGSAERILLTNTKAVANAVAACGFWRQTQYLSSADMIDVEINHSTPDREISTMQDGLLHQSITSK